MGNIVLSILSLFGGKQFNTKDFSVPVLLKYFWYQKILRINSSIPWFVHPTTKIKGQDKIDRGSRHPGMSPGCYIDGRNGITFGSNVWIGPHVKVISMNHDLYDYKKYTEAKPITVGDDCWIGAGAIILPQVVLGNHVVVAAGAVVTKSFTEDNIVIGGNPAKVIKKL